jgi:hypothetical protein
LRERLSECVEEDAAGKSRLTVTLPDRAALDHLAETLARLMAAGQTTPGEAGARKARAAGTNR